MPEPTFVESTKVRELRMEQRRLYTAVHQHPDHRKSTLQWPRDLNDLNDEYLLVNYNWCRERTLYKDRLDTARLSVIDAVRARRQYKGLDYATMRKFVDLEEAAMDELEQIESE